MFADAFKLARCFTKPVVNATRLFDKTVECECAAFVVLNDEGWIITVAHHWRREYAKTRKNIKASLVNLANSGLCLAPISTPA